MPRKNLERNKTIKIINCSGMSNRLYTNFIPVLTLIVIGGFSFFTTYSTTYIDLKEIENGLKSSAKSEIAHSKEVFSKTWPKVDLYNCSNIVFLHKGINEKNPLNLPRVGIVSFPGSGNTWIKYMIRQATGIWTGSVYNDRHLFEGGFLAEFDPCNNNSTIVIKAHKFSWQTKGPCPFNKIIYLVRDPFEAILAEFNRRHAHSHVDRPDEAIYNTEEWKKCIKPMSQNWLKTNRVWMQQFKSNGTEVGFTSSPSRSGNLLMVSYKRLKANKNQEMKRIVKFLQLPTYREKCILNLDSGNFKRKGETSAISSIYNGTNVKAVFEAEKRMLEIATKFGMNDLNTAFENDVGEFNTFR